MNILYVDYGNVVDDNYMYQYYGDLFRELKEQSKIFLLQGVFEDIDVILSQIETKIDCIIFGLGYFAQNNQVFFNKIKGLDSIDIPVICMIHKPQNMLQQKLDFCKMNNVDLIVDSQSTCKDYEKATGIRSIRLPFTATPKYFYPRDVEKKYDVGFSGALHGDGKIKGPTEDLRDRVYNELKKTDYNLFWNSSNTLEYRIHSTEEYATKINESKVWLATTGPVNDVSPRYFEVVMSKTLLLCNNMPEAYEDIFEDGRNCVMFENNLLDFHEKLNYYLQNDDVREKLVENAYNEFIDKYTWKHMALNLLEEVRKCHSK